MAAFPPELIETGAAFPLWGVFEQHPRTYIEVSEDDVLRDDGLCYARALEEAGVDVKVKVRKVCSFLPLKEKLCAIYPINMIGAQKR